VSVFKTNNKKFSRRNKALSKEFNQMKFQRLFDLLMIALNSEPLEENDQSSSIQLSHFEVSLLMAQCLDKQSYASRLVLNSRRGHPNRNIERLKQKVRKEYIKIIFLKSSNAAPAR
jgi:alkyl sulfatase BDS1-like metallo-beta-lactamase superfamily hydrolase